MAKLQYRTLSNRTVERLKVEKDTVFWDRELTGFGVRVYPTGGKVYPRRIHRRDAQPQRAVHRQGPPLAESRCRQLPRIPEDSGLPLPATASAHPAGCPQAGR